MSAKKIVLVVLTGAVLFVSVGWKAKTSAKTPKTSPQMKLTMQPQSETTYKVVSESGKDYSFVQPSVNKTKERHTVGRIEMVFVQKVESVDSKGVADVVITIKELKYLTDSQKDANSTLTFDSTAEKAKSDPMFAIIGQSYKISIAPNGTVSTLDAKAVRSAVASGFAKKFADRIFSDDEIKNRHQVLALMNADKAGKKANKMASKKGDKWVTVSASPQGMLKPKTFEKTYTITDVKVENKERIATVTMSAAPSSKRVETATKDDASMGFFANMFDEKDSYTGKMVINLTTGQIISYDENLKAEWFAAESTEEQKSDKGPDQLTMGFTNLYSIEKVK